MLSLRTSLQLFLLSQQTSALPETMKLLNRKMLRHLNENITIHLLNVFPNWSKLSSSNHCSRSAYYDTLLHCDSTTRWWLLAHVNKGKNFCPEARYDNGESTSAILDLTWFFHPHLSYFLTNNFQPVFHPRLGLNGLSSINIIHDST